MPLPLIFYRTGTSEFLDISVAAPSFDLFNPTSDCYLAVLLPHGEASVASVIRLAPQQRVTVQRPVSPGDQSDQAIRPAGIPDRRLPCMVVPVTSHGDRYRAYCDDEISQRVPVDAGLVAAMHTRAESILNESRELVTDLAMPAGTLIYTPGPFYRAAGLFARDLLYQLEGSGREFGAAAEIKAAVDFLALKQLRQNTRIGAYTYPRGAIPDHVYPDGRYCWGPGAFYGDDTAHFHRASMDASMCFITLGWHYGYKSGWDDSWKGWFASLAPQFAEAWHSVPRNPVTGLVTQWTTAGHIGASGIAETHDAGVMWGFHDSYGFGGDDVGVSVLACNAARALADMHEHAGHAAASSEWDATAGAMRDAIRAQFDPSGTLPWGVGPHAPALASPDITAYAAWSGILTPAQADAASDWFAARYHADRAAGGAADLFHMAPGYRGAVRMARKADDVSPGRHVWPDMERPHWENLTYGYNAYQDGGYWYTLSHCVATTLFRCHPLEALTWVHECYTDIISGGDDHPYERIDGYLPVNNRYNASVGPVLGMAVSAQQ